MPKLLLPWQQRYEAAYIEHQKRGTPNAYKDFGPLAVKWPNTNLSNGLTLFIVNFLNWSGHRAKRINVSGRLLDKVTITESGKRMLDKKWIKSSTAKGTADIDSTIRTNLGSGVPWKIEIKCGSDKARPEQLQEQIKERSAGGNYDFVHDPEEFFRLYDKILITGKTFP